MGLLSRSAFQAAVFERDGHACVVCRAAGADAHHVMERRLWPDGGYYLENGVTLCAAHHLAAEETRIGCDELRVLTGITRVVLPPHLDEDQPYDKWGNPVLPNGTRLRGELFFDESVQKVLGEARVLSLFTHHSYVHYRTAVGKYVRANHVVTHGHWMRQAVRANGLGKRP